MLCKNEISRQETPVTTGTNCPSASGGRNAVYTQIYTYTCTSNNTYRTTQ